MTTAEVKSPTATQEKTEKNSVLTAEAKRGIENHRKIAEQLQQAAKYHLEAAKNHEAGNHEKAYQNTFQAIGYNTLANELQKEDAKQHAINAEASRA